MAAAEPAQWSGVESADHVDWSLPWVGFADPQRSSVPQDTYSRFSNVNIALVEAMSSAAVRDIEARRVHVSSIRFVLKLIL